MRKQTQVLMGRVGAGWEAESCWKLGAGRLTMRLENTLCIEGSRKEEGWRGGGRQSQSWK